MSRETTTDLAVLERLLAPAGREVLDVGCGPGQLVRALAGLGARPIGLEISDAQLAAARAADDGAGARYLVGAAQSLPLEAGSVDVVVFMRSLHHVPVAAQLDALAEARRVLRDAGQVYVAEPLAEGSYFELMSLVEDERAVRAAAQRAVAAAPGVGLRRRRGVEYEVLSEVADLAALRRRIVTVDPDRAPLFDARTDEIAARLAELGEPSPDGGLRFRQPMRVDVLERDAGAAGVA